MTEPALKFDPNVQTSAPSAEGPDPVHGLQTRDRIRAVNRAILGEEKRLRALHPWLKHQDLLGLGCFFGALVVITGVRELYLRDMLTWWLAVPLIALPLSILHELEHDLIHNLYFKQRRWMQNLMMGVIWINKLSINPWYRREIHLYHHKHSGQKNDIEERLIGLGLPFGILRMLVTLHPGGALLLLPRIKRDAPEFKVLKLLVWSFPSFLVSAGSIQIFMRYVGAGWPNPGAAGAGLPAWGWSLISDVMVLLVLPAVIRQSSIVILSSYSHYYEDIPRHDVFYQNQSLRHWALMPFQLFTFNFGTTHIVHHYVVDQPFYLRQWVASVGLKELERQGSRVNDFGVVKRANRFSLAGG